MPSIGSSSRIPCIKMNLTKLSVHLSLFLFCALAAQAQLAVAVSPARITGQKAVVPLTMTNDLAVPIESARATCFLLDENGRMVGQSAKWVIGGTRGRQALQPKAGATFNFVITSPQSFATTNLTAKVSFSRIVLGDGQIADV